MSDTFVVTLNDDLRIVNVDSRKTSGLAHQLALRITDAGYRARVIECEDAEEVAYYSEQIKQKRTLGFVPEFGHIPNGDRSHGEGARTIGRMIYNPLGLEIEGVTETTLPVEMPGKPSPSPLLLSSIEIPTPSQKINDNSDKQYTITIGGKTY